MAQQPAALYRKYRPQTFRDLVGQQHVTQTLQNAIRTDRLAHAYIFSGQRGTGKTTTARLLAKALCCERGPTIEPCDECSICQRIRDGQSLDVIEIDAASNRGIDDIRQLRERVQYAPTEGRYKFYIVDEAHQITHDAFNAFLKTIEEPPPHAIFVLATTEPNKIPITITSRCQRLDFRRLSSEEIAERLRYVARKESLEVDDDALYAIVVAAGGAMRDALSLLDQVYTFSGNQIDVDKVRVVLGSTDAETLLRIAGQIAEVDLSGLVKTVAELVDAGRDLVTVMEELTGYARDLLLYSLKVETETFRAMPEEMRHKAAEYARQLGPESLRHVVDTLARAGREMRRAGDPRIAVELALLEAAKPPVVAAPAPATAPTAGPQRPAPQPSGPPPPRVRPSPVEVVDTNVDPIEPRTVEDVIRQFPAVLQRLREQRQLKINALLVNGRPVRLDGDVVTLGFRHEFHRKGIESPENKEIVTALLNRYFTRPLRIECRLLSDIDTSAPSSPPPAREPGPAAAPAKSSAPAAPPDSAQSAESDAEDDESAPTDSSWDGPDPQRFVEEALHTMDGHILDRRTDSDEG